MSDLTLMDQKLLEVAKTGDLDQVRQLLASGADVNCRGQHGMTPLLWASCGEHFEATRYLLSKGADVNYTGMREGSPLMLAAYAGQSKFISLYLEHGAEVNLALSTAGESALHMAAVKNRTEAAKLLIQAGANVNQCTHADVSTDMIEGKLWGETPLHFAAAYGDLETIEALLAAAADRSLTNAKGERPLNYAEREKRPGEIMDSLR
jgi:uncharacterized protein